MFKEIFTTKREKKEGLEIKVVSRFRRHADPDKDPETGLSMDSLKESGVEQAELIGCESKKEERNEKIKKTFHSPKQRAWETLAYMLNGAGREDVKVYGKSELDTMSIPDNVKEEMPWKNKEKKEKRNFDEMINFILNHPDCEKEIEKTAQRIAHRVNVATNMPHYLKEGDDVEMESITHGPVQEALLKEVIILDNKQGNKKTGFDSVEEIGGAFKPGEGFEIETMQGEDGKEIKKLNIYRLDEKGVKVIKKDEYEIDWDKVKSLGEDYRKEKIAEQKEKMKERK